MNICITEEMMVLEILIIANGNDNFVVLITDGRDRAQTRTKGVAV